ncbi:MAG: acyl-CoA dehydratase activase [Bacteroidota bacterium]
MQKLIGVCLGASTVSFVGISKDTEGKISIDKVSSIQHNGNPKNIFLETLKEFNPEKFPVVVTGRKFRNLVNLTVISEPQAIEYAVEFISGEKAGYSAVASLGGETFMVYTLDETGKISNIITRNQCASGTGEFFLQQIKRMDLGIEDVGLMAKDAQPYRVSGRCSVFCKSDCTHALNKGTPKPQVTAGLADMMADKVVELLKQVKGGKILVVGGVTKNQIVMDFLKKKIPNIFIPEEAGYFEALGAALYGLENETKIYSSYDDILIDKGSSFGFHKPLEQHRSKVQFKGVDFKKAVDGDVCLLGLDVGSTTTKAVIIRRSDNSILGSVYLYTLGNPIEAARNCYSELQKQIPQKIIIEGLGVTGSGRHIAGLHALTDGIYNEIIAHSTAAVFFDPEVDTIFEIGGQDAKYTYIVNKVPVDYAMNEACSAGTGSFIEESSGESLCLKVTEIEQIAMNGDNPPNFSDQCSAFISSDIKTALHENISKENVVAGLVYSVCLNYINRVKGSRTIGNKIFMQGGVCYNKAIPIAMAALTGKEIIVPPEPGLMGAFGVALEVKEKLELGLIDEKLFFLEELKNREVTYKKPFICPGGSEKCDLKCNVNLIQVEGKTYPFGGSCDKYYSWNRKNIIEIDNYDYVKKRNYLTFNKYAQGKVFDKQAKSVGINLSFHTHTLYPLFYNFLTQLGFRVILSDTVEEKGLERELTSFCYPGQLSLCLFQDLLNKNPDYFFIPEIFEMYVEDADYHRLDFNCTCVFVSGEPFYLKQAFKDYNLNGRMLTPFFNFANGFDKEESKFIEVAVQLGITDENIVRAAYHYALQVQDIYQNELYSLGEEFLLHLEKHPELSAIVLVGRPYNAFTETANKGIPQKFASRGVFVVPYDIFDYRNELIDENMYWEGGKKILKIAQTIKRHPQLFATYISNYSCGPDSMISTTFRSIMGSKPYLTLELDGHTADAGINTRIDAVLDIIKNYRKIVNRIKDEDFSDFTPAKIEFDELQGYFISSDGKKVPLSNENVVILIPSMGDLASELFAAGLRSQGFNAESLPEGSLEILKYGRANANGKECLPLLLCAGGLMNYLENRWDGKKYVAFFIVQGAGNCRLGQYPVFLRDLIKRKRLKNVATLVLMNEDGFAGLGPQFALRGMQTIITSDVMDDIRSAIMSNAVNPEKGLEIFNSEFKKIVETISVKSDSIYKVLTAFSKNINKRVPAKINIKDSKYIALVGEIYVRRDHFAHKWLNKYFAKKGFVVKDAYISEWIFYVDYLLSIKLLEPETSLKKKYERRFRSLYMRYAENKIKKILAKSGYYKFSKTEIEPLLKHSKHIIPLEFKGEPGLTLGIGLHETIEKYAGVINLGPFGCMPTRFTESVSVPEMNIQSKIDTKRMHDVNYNLPEIFNGKMNIPFLTIETDGNVYPQVIEARLETFALQSERMAQLMKIGKNGKH